LCVIFLKQRILDDFSKAILLRRTIKEAHSPKIEKKKKKKKKKKNPAAHRFGLVFSLGREREK
jgi:hypothetical protein